MTGFASKTITLSIGNEPVGVNMLLKSLNTRFFEVSCRLPHAFSAYETDLIKLFKKRLKRGQIYFTLHLSDPNCFKSDVTASSKTLDGYMKVIEQLKASTNITGEMTLDGLFKIPHLFVTQDTEVPEKIKTLLFDAIEELVDAIIASRLAEGEQIKADIQERINDMKHEIEVLDIEYTKNFEIKQQEIQDKFDSIKVSSEEFADNQRALLYQALDKMDLHEEITRFKGHLEQIETILNSDALEKGKQFDFTLQELAREANTMASKCSNAQISNHAIKLKVEIEKCREQVQNVV